MYNINDFNNTHNGISMKKILLITLSALFLIACSEEKEQFEQAVLEQMQNDQDIQDYNLDPERITRCIVDLVSKKIPGVFFFDPETRSYYVGYRKLISVKLGEDPEQTLLELHEIFGSAKATMQAQMNYSQSELTCITSLVTETEADAQ